MHRSLGSCRLLLPLLLPLLNVLCLLWHGSHFRWWRRCRLLLSVDTRWAGSCLLAMRCLLLP